MLQAKDRPVIEALLSSPAAAAAAEAHARTVGARRVELARDRAALEKTSEDRFRFHQRAQAAAYEECKAAEKALNAAKAKLGALLAARAGECHQLDTSILAIEAELQGSADPAIAEFIASLRVDLEQSMRARLPELASTFRNPNTGALMVAAQTPRVSQADRCQAIREAIAAAEALKLEADQTGLPSRLDALRSALPVIGAPKKAVTP